MHLPGTDTKALPRTQRDASKERRRIMRIEPVERTAQTVVAQILGGDPRP